MKTNLLVFSSTFPRWPSDPITARFVLDLAEELKAEFNVFVLTPHAPESQTFEDWNGLHIIRFPYFFPRRLQKLVDGTGMMSCMRKSLLAKLQIPFFLAGQYLALRRVIREHRINAVNSHWMIPQGFIAALLKQSLGFRHVVTVHAADLFALRRLPFGAQLARFIVNNTDMFYCVSRYNHDMLCDLVKADVPSRILPMGIHTGYYGETLDASEARKTLGLKNRKTILYVGKLSEKKGVTYLLQAFARIATSSGNEQLVIVGGGALENLLKEEAGKLGLGERVVFAGYQNKEKIRLFYKACDVVAIPSIIDASGETEGLPVVLLEALASGKPAVATTVGGMPDVIRDGDNGYLVRPGDPEDLAEKLRRVLEQPPETFRQKALASIHKYDWRKIGEDYAHTLQTIPA